MATAARCGASPPKSGAILITGNEDDMRKPARDPRRLQRRAVSLAHQQSACAVCQKLGRNGRKGAQFQLFRKIGWDEYSAVDPPNRGKACPLVRDQRLFVVQRTGVDEEA